MRRKTIWFTAFFITLFLYFMETSFAESNRHHPDQCVLPGGGPLAKLNTDHTFNFIIIGDTRTGISTFQQMINEINLLDPDMVINVGDMIDGYEKKPAKIEAMWDGFDQIVSQFKVPLVMVPGNHDIWDTSSQEIYHRRYGKLYFSFDHKGVHFVVLDTETYDSNGKYLTNLSEEQINWLENDLSTHRGSREAFIFMHRPLWQDIHVAKGARQYWFKHVHPILVKYGVSAVFAGHVHKYIKYSPMDGITYYITGGGGAHIENNPEQGDFYHYCLLKIRNNSWKMAVIKPGSVCPDTIVSEQMMIDTHVSVVDIVDNGKTASGELTIANLSGKKAIKIMIIPDLESNQHFKITNFTKTVFLNPGEERKVRLDIVLDDLKYIYPAPKLLLNVEGLSEKPFTVNTTFPVRTCKMADCRKAEGTVKIDGKLNEPLWEKATLLSDFEPPQADGKAKFQTETRITYDSQSLYLSFICHEPELSGLLTNVTRHDGNVWDDDSVEIFLDTNLDRETYYQFIINANAVIYDGMGRDGTWNGQCMAKASRGTDTWILEVGIPWKTMGMDAPKPGTRMGFEVTRSRAQDPSELTQWAPTFTGNHAPDRFGTIIIK